MAANAKRILTSRQEIMDYLGISKAIYLKFVKGGMPVLYVDGRCYAHVENINEYFKSITRTTARNLPDNMIMDEQEGVEENARKHPPGGTFKK